jgi:dUTP pyrophosphatase
VGVERPAIAAGAKALELTPEPELPHDGTHPFLNPWSGKLMSESSVDIALKMLDPELPVPSYAHEGDAGADLCAREDVTLAPGQRALVPTGVALGLPLGFVGLIHPRSGLATKHGLTVVNAPGTVDAGYRGELKVTLLNTDASTPIMLKRGDRIAQLVIQKVERARFLQVQELDDTARGAGGFGSTGGFETASTSH